MACPWPLPPRPSSLPWELCCPWWCKAITVRRGDQEMACPFLNSDQPENTHCTSGGSLAVMSESDLPPGARHHQEFSLGCSQFPSLHSHTEGTWPCCQDGEVVCFCLPAFVKEGLSLKVMPSRLSHENFSCLFP